MRTVPEMSACAWCLTGPPDESLRRLRGLGFDMVDLRTDCWDGVGLDDLRNAGLTVPCVGITPAPLPNGLTMDSLATSDAESALPCLVGSLERVASLGLSTAYMVTPPSRVGDTETYVRSMSRLGDEAARLGVKLCVEPSPGFALGDYTETIRLLDAAKSDGLYALLDLGHLLLTGGGSGRNGPNAWRPPWVRTRRRQRRSVRRALRSARRRIVRTDLVQLSRRARRLQL